MGHNVTPIITGTEMEYGFASVDMPSSAITDTDLARTLPEGLSAVRGYLSNGSRFYVDMGHKIEYATPECLTVKDVVHAEFAGEHLVLNAMSRLVEDKKLSPYPLRKDVVDEAGNTWGYHENYLMSRELYNSRAHHLFLMGHLATSSVLTGAGRAFISDDGELVVYPSQKMHEITELFGSGATSRKALINIRDEPLANRDNWARQHIVCTDPNLTARITSLKIGATKLVLRLAEFNDVFGFIKPERIMPHNALSSARKIAKDGAGNKRVYLVNGKVVSALNIQEELAIQAYKLSSKVDLPDDEVDSLHLWLEMHDVAKYSPDKAERQIEHRALKSFLDHYAERHGKITNQIQLNRILNNYFCIDPERSIGRKWLSAADDEYHEESYEKYLLREPPHGTRADDRSMFIRYYQKPGQPQLPDNRMTWEGGTINEVHRRFDNPFGSSFY